MSVRKAVAAGIATAVIMGSALALTTGVRAQQGQTPSLSQEAAVTKGVFGDWKLRCENQPGAQNVQCVISQKVVDEASPDMTLSLVVYRTADGKKNIMRVLMPLGLFLPRGLGLKIDDAMIGRVGFVRCLSEGCIAEVEMNDELLDKLKTGKTAVFAVFKTLEQGVGIPLNLNGFADAYNNLPKVIP